MIDPRKTIVVNGQEVAEGWDVVLAEAQNQRTYSIDGEVLERIPFGEDWSSKSSDVVSCCDCAAARGQLHVPICGWEQCPSCGEQAVGCDCPHENDPLADDEDDQDDDGEVQE
jgi:hypothetical protein